MLLFYYVHYKISRIVFEWNINLVQSVFVVGTRIACPNSSNKQTKNTFSFQLHTSLIRCFFLLEGKNASKSFDTISKCCQRLFEMFLNDPWIDALMWFLVLAHSHQTHHHSCGWWSHALSHQCPVPAHFAVVLFKKKKNRSMMMQLKQSTVEFLLSCYFVFLTWWHPPVSSPHPFFCLLLASLGLACVTARVSLCSTSFHLQSDCL